MFMRLSLVLRNNVYRIIIFHGIYLLAVLITMFCAAFFWVVSKLMRTAKNFDKETKDSSIDLKCVFPHTMKACYHEYS